MLHPYSELLTELKLTKIKMSFTLTIKNKGYLFSVSCAFAVSTALSEKTNCRIVAEKDGREACNILHAAGPSKVLLYNCLFKLFYSGILCISLNMPRHLGLEFLLFLQSVYFGRLHKFPFSS